MNSSVIPYADADLRILEDIRIFWDDAVAKLAGCERWRYVILVDHLEHMDGSHVQTPDGYRVFAQLKFGTFHSLYDARQGLTAHSPMEASQIVSVPLRVVRDSTRMVSIFFSTNSISPGTPGVSVAYIVPSDESGLRGDSFVR